MISVIVPVYNVKSYLKKCIESILNQTYSNLEIILVDDGSTDGSNEVCKYFERLDSRIRLIEKENGGLSSARNAGLEVAKGDYISFIDSDDWIEKDFIENLLFLLEKYNADISQCSFVRDNGTRAPKIYKDTTSKVISGKEALKNLYNRRTYLNTVVMWNKLYKKKIFEKMRFEEGIINEDEAIIHEILYSLNRVVINSSTLYHYYVRSNSIMQSEFSLKKLDSIYVYEKRISYFLEKNEKELHAMTLPIYFRTLLNVGSGIFNSNIENKEIYLLDINQKINNNIALFKKNNYMQGLSKLLLIFYRVKPNFGFIMNNKLSLFKKKLAEFK